MTMASWTIFLSSFILVVSVNVPSNEDVTEFKDASTNSSKRGEYTTESSNKADLEIRKNGSSTRTELQTGQAGSASKIEHVNSVMTDSVKFLLRQGTEERKGREVNNPPKDTTARIVSGLTRLMQFLSDQSFRLRTNFPQNHTLKMRILQNKLHNNEGELFNKNRFEKLIHILAIFGENFEKEQRGLEPDMELENETSWTTTEAPFEDLSSCLHVEGYDEHQWISMVNFCPRTWNNQTVRYLCKNALIQDYAMTDTPVQDHQGTVYTNRFCALCNNVSNIMKWRIAWTCDDQNPVIDLLPPGPPRDLMTMLTTLRRAHSCKLIRTPAIPGGIRSCPSSSMRDSHQMPPINAGDHIPPGSGYPVSLNILMNFDFSGKTHIMFADFYAEESTETKLCPRDNYVWDATIGQCREVVCARGFHFDDTYTTCIRDENDNPPADHEDEVITDLSQLAQSNDIERVTLTVEVPAAYVTLLMDTEYHELWRAQIASQLNITIKRIQMFNMTFEDATGEGNTLVIEKLSEDDIPPQSWGEEDRADLHEERSNPIEDHDSEIYNDGGDNEAELAQEISLESETAIETSEEEGIPYKPTSSASDMSFTASSWIEDYKRLLPAPVEDATSGDDLTVEAQSEENRPQSNLTDSLPSQASAIVSSSSKKYATPQTAPPILHTTLAPQKFVKVVMSFILLPPKSFRSGQRSGSLVEELSSLVSKGELKFTINGTSLVVDNIDQEDKVGVFSPPCPNGLLLVLDGEKVRLLYESDPDSDDNITMLMDLESNKIYMRGMFDVSLLVTQPIGNTTQKPQSYIYNALACEMPRIANSQCKRIRITAEEYTIDSVTKTLTFQNAIYNISSYEFLDDNYQRVEICVPESYSAEAVLRQPSRLVRYKNCATNYEQWLKAEGWLTTVLGRVSIVALFSVLFTYCLFPKLRNLPGVNTMNLTFALFLAEVIFITGEEVQIPWLCTGVAVSLHYCFLASHCWMNVMSYDVFRTFAGSACILTRVRDKNKFFPRYALFAWGMPLLVIGVCLFIDLSHVFPGISIGYGGTWSDESDAYYGNWSMEESFETVTTTTTTRSALPDSDDSDQNDDAVQQKNTTDDDATKSSLSQIADRSFSCWIQKPLAAMFAFGAPILLIFLMNCVFFTRTIASIQRTNRLARHSGADRTNSSNSARQLSGRNDVILYVKMSTVMGFTWIFGLASSLISAVIEEPSETICYVIHVLGVLFPIFNSLQGLFIFFAFVFNRRVLVLYKVLAGKIKKFVVSRKKKLIFTSWNRPMTNIATITRE